MDCKPTKTPEEIFYDDVTGHLGRLEQGLANLRALCDAAANGGEFPDDAFAFTIDAMAEPIEAIENLVQPARRAS